MRATLRPNRLRICFGVADVSSRASWSSAAIASFWLPPPSSTNDATPSRCAAYGTSVPFLVCLRCNEHAYFDRTCELLVEHDDGVTATRRQSALRAFATLRSCSACVVAKYVFPFLSET